MRAPAALFFLALFLCLPCASQDAPAAELVLKIAADAVEVYSPSAPTIPLQRLPFEPDLLTVDNREYFAIAEDMNFDALPDVRVLSSQGLHNIYYDCWLWRPKAKAFAKDKQLGALSDPAFDPTTRRVSSYTHISAAANVESAYIFKNGELTLETKTEQDFDPDRDRFVVKHYARDAAGAMRQESEEFFTLEQLQAMRGAENQDNHLAGINFFPAGLPYSTEMLDFITLPDGRWWGAYRLSDDGILLEARRLKPIDPGEKRLRQFILAEWPEARDILLAPFPELSERLKRPALKAEFLAGPDENVRLHLGTSIYADDWSFWFEVNAPAGARHDGAGDVNASVKRLENELGKTLQTIDLLPAGDHFLYGGGAGLYLAGEAPGADAGDDILTALLRIKREADPEGEVDDPNAEVAYRYDGFKAIPRSDLALHTFSFGADLPEKFTAERHFGVDARGMVYEMDILAGGIYLPVGGFGAAVPVVWSTYRDGDKVLSVGNFREEAEGLFFDFSFRLKEKEIGSGVAAVTGGSASYCGLTITLNPNDGAMWVTADAATARCPDAEWIRDCAGIYQDEN